MYSVFIKVIFLLMFLAGHNDAISKITQMYFTKNSSNNENFGIGLIKGLNVHSLPFCASVCTITVNCSAFNFYNSCPNSENAEINCKLYNNSKAFLVSNPCCTYYAAASNSPNLELVTVVTTTKATVVDPSISNELLEDGSIEDFSWNEAAQTYPDEDSTPQPAMQSQPGQTQLQPGQTQSQPGTMLSQASPSTTTTAKSSNIQQKQATSADLKVIYAGFTQVVPTVQCLKNEDPPACMVKTANWSSADSFCKQYGNGKGQLASITSDVTNAAVYSVLTNATICPPFCNFWIGLHVLGSPAPYFPNTVQFTWGPWLDGSEYRYNNWATGYPKQLQGTHYPYMMDNNGQWGSDTDNNIELPFLCIVNWFPVNNTRTEV